MLSWQNEVLETPTVAETTTKAVLSTLAGVYTFFCQQIFVKHDSVATVLRTGMKLYRYVVGPKMKAEFEDWCGSSTR